MIDKLQAIKDRWLNIQDELNDPMVISNQRKFAQLNRDYKELQKVVEAYEKYRLLVSNIENNRQILNTEKDADFRDLVDHHARHLVGRALVEAHVDLGIGLAQPDDRHRQHVARLGVGGGDRQRPASRKHPAWRSPDGRDRWRALVQDAPDRPSCRGQREYGWRSQARGVRRRERGCR